ncbi:MAG: hypothetical protein WBF05_06430 [Anaerolineales bacterium]
MYEYYRSVSFLLHTRQAPYPYPRLPTELSAIPPKKTLGKMLDIGKVPGQSYAQLPKSKAANASAAKHAASQRYHGGVDSEKFHGLCRGIFSLGLRRPELRCAPSSPTLASAPPLFFSIARALRQRTFARVRCYAIRRLRLNAVHP